MSPKMLKIFDDFYQSLLKAGTFLQKNKNMTKAAIILKLILL
mgnify:CR=1 FL=1